jgi:Skp family chaperone for outer membrane proteins
MRNYQTLLVCLALFLAACPVGAQGKIGTIDLRKVFDDYHKTKTADAALKERAADLDKERKAMVEAYQKTKEDYEKALNSTSDQAVSADERDRRKKAAESKLLELRAKEQEITQFDREARTNLEEQQRRMREKILEEIRAVINVKAKAAGHAMVLDSAAESANRTPVLLYTSGENDLTAAVLDQLNANAPAGSDKKKDEKK